MNSCGKWFRRANAAALSVAMLGLSVAIPVLEQTDLVHEPVVESEHNPATCPRGHDHTICTQVGASFSAPADPTQDAPSPEVVPTAGPAETPLALRSWFADGRHSRAPPLT